MGFDVPPDCSHYCLWAISAGITVSEIIRLSTHMLFHPSTHACIHPSFMHSFLIIQGLLYARSYA